MEHASGLDCCNDTGSSRSLGLPIGLTVAVCTRNRPEQVRRALFSLARETRPPNEIIVVDNAPADNLTRALVAEQFPYVRYIQEPLIGLNFARNRALHEAGHPIVAFMDDDAVADLNWAKEMVEVFRVNPEVGVCTGQIQPLSLETEAQRLFEATGGFSRGEVRIRLPLDAGKPLHGRRAPLIAWAVRLGIGCNMALRRSVALAIGGFDEALDRGKMLAGGGDVDMLWRVLMNGHDVLYEPRALVWHEHRRELHGLFEQLLGHHLGMLSFLARTVTHPQGSKRLSVLLYLTWRLLKPGVRLVRRFAGHDPLPKTLILRMWLNSWRGIVDCRNARGLRRHPGISVTKHSAAGQNRCNP